MAEAALAGEDVALLERLATRLVALRLETPALLALETARPVALLASQAMVFFEPFALALFAVPDYRRYAALVERREAIDHLAARIEALAGDRARERRPGAEAR